jgi:hypothetical protein
MKSTHDNLNRLRVKIAKQKDVSLAKLPPCEASFVQHVLRVSLQTYIWMKSDTAFKSANSSMLSFGVFSTVFFPIPKNEDVVSQPVKACTAGNNLHTRGPWIWQINRLRVKIAKQKGVSLTKLPPCEASFVQHVLRASLRASG